MGRVIFTIVLVATLGFFLTQLYSNVLKPSINTVVVPDLVTRHQPSTIPAKPDLTTNINTILHNKPGTYSVIVSDLSADKPLELVNINSDQPYGAASLYKLWVLAEAYRQIEAGNLKLADNLSANITDLYYSYGVSTLYSERKSGWFSLDLEDALYNMITVSENDSALLVSNYVGMDNVQTFLTDFGLDGSDIGDLDNSPNTTPADTRTFFENLYYGKTVSSSSTADILDLLAKQQLNTKIPALLPRNTKIAHKTGELFGFSHDAGIVYTDNPVESNKVISQISLEVYNYFTSNNHP
jgi:beta-lactamase class A